MVAVLAIIVILVLRQPGWIPNPFEPTPTPTPAPATFLLAAEVAYQEGRLDDAIAAYSDYLALQPEDDAVWAQLARLQILNDQREEGLESAKKAMEIDRDDAYNNAIYGWALDWNRDYDRAIEFAIHAVDLDPLMAEARAYLAETYADLGNWRKAEDEGEEAVRLNPESVDANRALAYAYHIQGKYAQAIDYYQEAIRLHPQLARLYYETGLNFSALGEFEDAIEYYRQAIGVDPDYGVAYDALGWAYYYQDDPERAIIELERAVEIAPDNTEAFAHLGMALYRRQRYEDATEPLKHAIELGADDNEAYFYTLGLSYIYGDPRDCESAVIWLTKALELNPLSQPALVGLQTCDQ